MCKNFSSGTGFERMKGSWTTADTWHSESPLVKMHLHLLWVNQLLNVRWRAHNETAGEKLVKDQPEETLVYQECEEYETTGKDSSSCGLEPICIFKTSYVCYEWQDQKDGNIKRPTGVQNTVRESEITDIHSQNQIYTATC